ncbi:MAG: hypothetical protein RLZZ597_1803 [Cyanobacteriota bacterium]|jgi:hypothetical protein
MVNPSALGVAFLVLLATTTMVRSSPPNQPPFQVTHPSLGKLLADNAVGAVVGAYQHQTNTISLDRESLTAAQRLAIRVPEGVAFQGTLTINDLEQQTLPPEGVILDLRSVLAQGVTEITLEGRYDPDDAEIMVSFENPETTVRQRVGQQGNVDYHIEFRID